MASQLYVDKILHWNKNGVPSNNKPDAEVYWKSISQSARDAAPTHCGPHGSYPLGPGCNHVSAAFTLGLSGHGSPSMGCIRNYARSHGCHVPESNTAKKARAAGVTEKEWLKGYTVG
jgi:hypothetical protein